LFSTTVSLDRLRDLRRRYLAEETELIRAIECAQLDLDRWFCTQRHLVDTGRISASSMRRLCESLDEGLSSIVRDLAEVRSAIRGVDEEIHELETKQHAPPQHLRKDSLHARLVLHSR